MLNKFTGIGGKKKLPTDMISLFDYLGYPAGSRLGEKVAAYAKIRKTKYATRYISNPSYQGEVMLYTREFLDEYFKVEDIFIDKIDYDEINTQLTEDSYTKSQNDLNNLIF